jgi:hypothetical protein
MGVAELARLMKVDAMSIYGLDAYFDESGDETILCLAGLLGPPDRWTLFEKEWRDLLRLYEVTEFHMVDCEAGRGEWAKLKDDRAARHEAQRKFLTLLLDVELGPIGGYVAGIHLPSFALAGRGDERAAWLAAFRRSLHSLGGLQAGMNERFGSDDGLGLIFDNRDKVRGESQAILQEAATSVPVKPVAFVDSRDEPAVQAADLVAWEMRRAMSDALSRPDAPNRRGFQRLIETAIPLTATQRFFTDLFLPDSGEWVPLIRPAQEAPANEGT